MDCSPPGSSVHGIPQARILEWGALSFSRGYSWPRDWGWVSHIAARFAVWATRDPVHGNKRFKGLFCFLHFLSSWVTLFWCFSLRLLSLYDWFLLMFLILFIFLKKNLLPVVLWLHTLISLGRLPPWSDMTSSWFLHCCDIVCVDRWDFFQSVWVF